jgi:Uma2 family endonuclease
MRPREREATYDDILALPEHLVGEIVEGELFVSPRPASPHAFAVTVLISWLYRYFGGGGDGPAGWWFLVEPELHLDDDVLVPDIAGWRRTRMPVLPSVSFFTLEPDWVCEAVSPKTTRIDRFRKLPRYAHHGVPYAWILDPLAYGVEIYRLEGERFSLIATHEGETTVYAEPFEAVGLDLATLWLPTPPDPQS